jgi:hypothetical protein
VDTKEVLLRAVEREKADLWNYYLKGDFHLNETGNQLVADAVAEALRRGDARIPRSAWVADRGSLGEGVGPSNAEAASAAKP